MSRNWSQDKYLHAFRFAAAVHNNQKFPGTDWPYIVHTSMVCMEVKAALAADGVLALTKNAALPKDARMTDSLDRILRQPAEVAMVKLADRITNLQPRPVDWTNEKRKTYLEQAREPIPGFAVVGEDEGV